MKRDEMAKSRTRQADINVIFRAAEILELSGNAALDNTKLGPGHGSEPGLRCLLEPLVAEGWSRNCKQFGSCTCWSDPRSLFRVKFLRL